MEQLVATNCQIFSYAVIVERFGLHESTNFDQSTNILLQRAEDLMQLLWSNMYPQSELDNYKLQVDLLQEKLKLSEENRQQLQKDLQQILQRRSEHDKSVRTKIRQKYQSFLDEQERRNERNKMLLQMIERIDQQTAALSARTERLKMMKLQYERYFAKLMQAQPMRCIPNVVPTTRLAAEATPLTGMTAPTQIPVLLPAVAAQPPAAAPPVGALSGVKSEVAGATMPAPTAVPPAAGHLEAMTDIQSAALTPRMWTFAMATPTPAGLLLSGAPTGAMGGALQATATPFEFLQYPLGYGPIIQPQPLHQQMSSATPTRSSTAFGKGTDVSLNKYGLTDNTIPTAEAATSTELPSMLEKSTGEISNKQTETMPHSTSSMEGSAKVDESVQTMTYGKSTQMSSTQPFDKLPEQRSDHATSIKASINTPADVFREPRSPITEVVNGVSAVKLEDANIVDDVMSHIEPTVSSTKPQTSAKSSYSFEEDNKSTSDDDWRKGNGNNLSTAEEHRRKIAEIEQRYGTIADDQNCDYGNTNMDVSSNETFTGFKRFSEIVKPKSEASAEELSTMSEILENQSWHSHTGSVENAATVPTTKPISNSKIDNIENAIYGELVNPQLPEAEAAQGFFTELLEQQETPLDNNMDSETQPEEQDYTTIGELEKLNLSEDVEYTNYNPAVESDNSGDLNTENSVNEPSNPQNQATYGTSDPELYQPADTFNVESAYGTAETANNYAEYPTEQKTDASFTDAPANHQQQEPQPEYSQQDYENYDATQYGNYDPNAYPGYIYDETTGQYVVDPQYVAPDADNTEAIYSAQDYTEPQEQQPQQMEYSTDQAQEVSYTYEDQAATTTEQTVFDSQATAVDDANLTTSPAAAVEPPVAQASKVVKPTSILSTVEKHAMQSDAQKKKKRVNFVDSSETDDSSSAKAPGVGAAAAGGESDFDFSSFT